MATLSADRPRDAIAALLQERQRYEQWMVALESRRAATPPHVYARVRADYEGRLSRVIDELGGRTAELRQVVDALSSQVASLQDEETAKRDLQAEAELRAAVGEYTPEQWREVSQSSQAELARLAALKAGAASELAQVQQLLNMASNRRSAASAPAGPPAPAQQVPAAPPPVGRPAPRPGEPLTGGRSMTRPGEPTTGASRQPARVDPPPDQTGFDELAFLHSVVERKPGAPTAGSTRPMGEPSTRPPVSAPAAAAPAAAPVSQRAVAQPAIQASELAAAPPPAPAPIKPVAPPLPAPPRPTVTPPEAALINPAGLPGGKPEAPTRRGVMDSESVPVFLRDVPSEQVKTLKCAECGTMNYPTEWYCERCGGELAAM